MKNLLFKLFICFLIASCNNSKKSSTKLTQLIPESSSVILSINDIESFKSDLKNNALINKLEQSSFYKNLSLTLEKLNSFNTTNKLLICFDTTENRSNYTIITKYSDSLFNNHKLDSTNWYYKTIDSVYFGSSSEAIVNAAITRTASSFESLHQSTNTNASFSILVNTQGSNNIGNSILKEDFKNFANWIMMDAQITPEQISLNGISTAKDTLPQLINIFKNTIPQENDIHQITPLESDGFLSFTYDDYEVLYQNILSFNQQSLDSISTN